MQAGRESGGPCWEEGGARLLSREHISGPPPPPLPSGRKPLPTVHHAPPRPSCRVSAPARVAEDTGDGWAVRAPGETSPSVVRHTDAEVAAMKEDLGPSSPQKQEARHAGEREAGLGGGGGEGK